MGVSRVYHRCRTAQLKSLMLLDWQLGCLFNLQLIEVELRQGLSSKHIQAFVNLEDPESVSDRYLLNFGLNEVDLAEELVLSWESLLDKNLAHLRLTILTFTHEMKV